jgi:serpin B
LTIGTGQSNAQNYDTGSSVNSYSFDLYHKAKVEGENLLLSPPGTYYALLMAYEGSANRTKQEFEKVLFLKSSAALKSDYLHDLLITPDSCPGLIISNAIWLDKSLQVESEYINSLSDKYFSDLKRTDFNKRESAVSDINRWYSEKTNRRINEVVESANINSVTKLLISNAVYFKGEWHKEFEKKETISAPFFSGVENQYTIDFMKMTETLHYFENTDFQFISKPYRDSDLSFCIILPGKLFGIEEIEEQMNSNFLKEILDNTYLTCISLSIPKLKLESTCELSDALKRAGLRTAFSSEADFSGITKEVPLMLEKVIHKTWIELDEEKTEAAAATAVVVKITGKSSYKVFKADHPFVFFVLDNRSGSILFIGRYIKPEDGESINKENITKNLENRMQEIVSSASEGEEPLIVINGEIMKLAGLDNLDPEEIKSIRVLKGEEALEKYQHPDGVIVIKLKKRRNRK